MLPPPHNSVLKWLVTSLSLLCHSEHLCYIYSQVRNKLHSLCVHDVMLHDKEIFCPNVGGVHAIDKLDEAGATTVTRQCAMEEQ